MARLSILPVCAGDFRVLNKIRYPSYRGHTNVVLPWSRPPPRRRCVRTLGSNLELFGGLAAWLLTACQSGILAVPSKRRDVVKSKLNPS